MEVRLNSRGHGDRGDRRRNNRDDRKGGEVSKNDVIRDLSFEARKQILTDKYDTIKEKIEAPTIRSHYRYEEEHRGVNNWENYWIPYLANDEAVAARTMLSTQREIINEHYRRHYHTSTLYVQSLDSQIGSINEYKRYQDPSGQKGLTDLANVLEPWELTIETHAVRDSTQQDEWNALSSQLAAERGRYERSAPSYPSTITGISDPRLVEDHRFLSGSAPFRSLHRMATSDTPITLVEATDSTAIYQSRPFYYEDVHRISVPLKDKDGAPRSREDVRADLIWEMVNASSRRSLQRNNQLLPEPLNANASPEERELYHYKRAKYALDAEWNEWRNILEYDHRVMAINADPKLGGEGPHVTRRFGVYFRNTDQNWTYFKNYMEAQRSEGHTLHYDPDAAHPDWVGMHLLAVAQERYPDSLVITYEEVESWKSETTKRIKSSSNNPFLSETIIERARKKI